MVASGAIECEMAVRSIDMYCYLHYNMPMRAR